ncbi:hypothetical protein D3C85_1235000 [compost metagenome]
MHGHIAPYGSLAGQTDTLIQQTAQFAPFSIPWRLKTRSRLIFNLHLTHQTAGLAAAAGSYGDPCFAGCLKQRGTVNNFCCTAIRLKSDNPSLLPFHDAASFLHILLCLY